MTTWFSLTFFCLLMACLTSPAFTTSSPSKERDALEDDADDAASYARYMAATEASAPLVRPDPSARLKSAYRSSSSAASSMKRVAMIHSTGSYHAAATAAATATAATFNRRYPLTRQIVYVWSVWSDWSACSRSCASGVASRHRTCQRQLARITVGSGIRSSYQQCIGESSEYLLCNQQDCPVKESPPPVDDSRHLQCSIYNNRTVHGHYVSSWAPNPSASNPCELSCRAQDRRGLVYTFGKVEDGTRCSVDSDHIYHDFCINGRCLAAGCDGRVGSKVKSDMCNVCGGSNTTCQRMAAVAFPAQVILKTRNSLLRSYGYSPVVRIPRGATNVRMTENSTNYIALMDEGRGYFLNGNWIIDWPGLYQASGASFNYQRTKDIESIACQGPLKNDVIVMVLVRERGPGIYYEYWLPRNSNSNGNSNSNSSATTLSDQSRTTETPAVASTTPSSDKYEAQPTAARLIKAPPRSSYIYRDIFKPSTTTTAIPTTTTTTTTAATATTATTTTPGPRQHLRRRKTKHGKRRKQKKTKKKKKKRRKETVEKNGIDVLRQHLAAVPRKHSNSLISNNNNNNNSSSSRKPAKHFGCRGSSSCWKTSGGKKHFCLSEFVMRCRVLGYEVIKGETRYEVQVIQSYKNVVPIISREFIWAPMLTPSVSPANCRCRRHLKTNGEYIIMGKTDRHFRRNEVRLMLDADSYVRVYNQRNAERVIRIRMDEAKYCLNYRTHLNLTT